MSDLFVLVQLDGAHGPGLLPDLLESRGRSQVTVRHDQDEQLPDIATVRATVILGGIEPDDVVRRYADACRAADIPVLGLGLGGGALVAGVAAHDAALMSVRPTDDATGDDIFGGLETDTPLVGGAMLAANEHLAMATIAGQLAAVRVGEHDYALGFQPQYDAAWLAHKVADPDSEEGAGQVADLMRRNRFVRPNGIALLGRWVDAVVGRTESEAPWGRSGPPPVAAEGLYLNPA